MSKLVKFKKTGKWADSNPAIPQLEAEAGKTYEVSNELADIIIEAGAGELVAKPKEPEDAKGADDKAKADKGKK